MESGHLWYLLYAAIDGLGLPSICKDIASGTFNDIDVPGQHWFPFCSGCYKLRGCDYTRAEKAGNKLVWLCKSKDQYDLPDYIQALWTA